MSHYYSSRPSNSKDFSHFSLSQLNAMYLEASRQIHPGSKTRNQLQVSEVFTLSRLEGPERKHNGLWAIASAVKDFSVVVDCHDGTLTVKPENLQPIDEPDARRQLPQILKRIRRLREQGILDRCAYTVLKSLGKQTYLTPMEEKFLRLMEHEYGIND